eukprot:CAMPEP_0119036636 /NCGR_PEP_ID=MMETSP1177-20130426/4473_1 /TAXON_ID=2985 /ORGANISM="Ochromonas sp, Strain CCMP1899" /LENGTH=540 /DNA_ID=CAMNT_0006996791 /DNA_START=146 /DNA_END=1768 /DNA_ORIENTATION=-
MIKIVLLITPVVGAFGVEQEYEWRSRSEYYYQSVQEKMKFILSSNCMTALNTLEKGTIQLPASDNSLNVASMPVKQELLEWWKSIPSPKQMRVDPYLCQAVMMKKRPIFNNTGCQISGWMNPGSPRCQNKYLKYICEKSQIPIDNPQGNDFVVPESNHMKSELPPQPWLLTIRNSFVSMCGDVSTKCGLVRTQANCQAIQETFDAKLFQSKCPLSLQDKVKGTDMNGTCLPGAPFTSYYEKHKKLFIAAEHDDTHVYHLHLEIMPRIIYHLDFLLANPNIKILIGCDSQKNVRKTESGIAHLLMAVKPLFELAGLSMDRLVVHTHVFANEIYLPMEGGCQDPVYNTWQILTMRERFMRTLNISEDTGSSISSKTLTPSRPIMLLLKRSSGAKHTRNSDDLVRQWSGAFTERLMNALRNHFPGYEVKLFSDRDERLMTSQAAQIRAFAEADVLIGVHGAGLSNQIYMKPNSAIVELCPYGNDGRCLLGGGPFSRAAVLMSHNYMIHHPPKSEFKWILSDMTSEFNIERFILHISSYLQSIG